MPQLYAHQHCSTRTPGPPLAPRQPDVAQVLPRRKLYFDKRRHLESEYVLGVVSHARRISVSPLQEISNRLTFCQRQAGIGRLEAGFTPQLAHAVARSGSARAGCRSPMPEPRPVGRSRKQQHGDQGYRRRSAPKTGCFILGGPSNPRRWASDQIILVSGCLRRMCSSRSCCSSTTLGARVSRHGARGVWGKRSSHGRFGLQSA